MKFSKSRVWNKVPDGTKFQMKVPYFWRYPNSLEDSTVQVEGNLYGKDQHDP